MAEEAWEAPMLLEFQAWYTALDGFGDYLKYFLAHYGHFFKEHQETHAFVYTKLHREFAGNLEAAVNAWLASKGMTESHLDAMLGHARARGDETAEGIVDALVKMLEYHTWIAYILSLKTDPQVTQLMEDNASKPGWETVGGTQIQWGTKWWEKWTDAEWEEWSQQRQSWANSDWENWWGAREDAWNDRSWEDRQAAWADRSWAEEAAALTSEDRHDPLGQSGAGYGGGAHIPALLSAGNGYSAGDGAPAARA